MSQSKEPKLLELFFNEPTKQWRFTELKKRCRMADNKLTQWLKKFQTTKLIKRVKPHYRMPYYVSDYESANYQNKKKLFALESLYNVGLLNHLTALDQVKTAIIFGSFSRWDWHSQSDVDIFIYGSDALFEKGKYELALHREIQLFTSEHQEDLQKISNKLLKNIIQGTIIKGSIDFVKVSAHA